MNSDFFFPEIPIGDKVNCLTLTKLFFDKNNIDSKKDKLHKNFISYDQIPIQFMDQVHGNNSQMITSYSSSPKKDTDALITRESNIALAALSADCLPITLSKSDGSQFAIIHAGWEGLFSGVIESSLSCFTGNKKDLRAWIGPSISRENYEVGNDFYNSFVSKDKDSKTNFTKKNSDKWLFDLREEAQRILRKFKIRVQSSDICTYESNLLYSYRQNKTENRIVTIIWRNE